MIKPAVNFDSLLNNLKEFNIAKFNDYLELSSLKQKPEERAELFKN